MRRLLTSATLAALVVGTLATPALAGELDDLLERSGEAAYTAEQTISCSTPDGARDAVVQIVQTGPQLRVTSTADEGSEILSGAGDWSLRRGEGVVSSASVESAGNTAAPVHEVERVGPIVFLDRAAMRYRLNRDGVERAELIFDLDTGALVASTTFNADGSTYCRRRFVSFEPGVPELTTAEQAAPAGVEPVDTDLGMPEVVAGFQRLDQYRDEEGVRFSYFSDGFFSFAVFEARSEVVLPGGAPVRIGDAVYSRVSSPGQVTYVWQTGSGVMALVGDMPVDLQEAILAELPPPSDPGFFREVWRTLFG
ncbi:MAG: hypothetical protein ACRDVL_04180 [Acidimicrobiia bacterium]